MNFKSPHTHNIPFPEHSNPDPAQQFGDVGHARGEAIGAAAALDVEAYQWLGVGAAQVEAPVGEGEAHAVRFIQ